MILDTSAVVAILRNEPDAPLFANAIEHASHCCISAVSYVESAVIIDASRDPVATRQFDEFMQEAQVAVEAVTANQANIA